MPMKTCENCSSLNNGNYGSGRFCSSKCARGFSTKNKRNEINLKVSKTMTGSGNGNVSKKCKFCKKKFVVEWNKRKQTTCSTSCSLKLNWKNDEYRNNISNKMILHASSKIERDRLRDIGRIGGFGTKGETKQGTKYQSKLERDCFEYLELKRIKFEPHKRIPNSSKISDIYIISLNLWIEIDGIDREKRKKWLGKNYEYWLDKLKIYNKEKLNFKIVKTLEELKQIVS